MTSQEIARCLPSSPPSMTFEKEPLRPTHLPSLSVWKRHDDLRVGGQMVMQNFSGPLPGSRSSSNSDRAIFLAWAFIAQHLHRLGATLVGTRTSPALGSWELVRDQRSERRNPEMSSHLSLLPKGKGRILPESTPVTTAPQSVITMYHRIKCAPY